jgi:cell division septation protein DedD
VVAAYAEANDIPWLQFGKDDDKLAVVRAHLDRQAATGTSGVAAIGVAQEFQRVWAATQGKTATGTPRWSFSKADRRVSCYYVYLWDADFGPAFVKMCAWFPDPGKVWRNGHEWAKRQATKAGVGFTELANGFAACDDPQALQVVCDRLGPGTIGVFIRRWLARLPLPLTDTDRDGGYWWEASMRQVEVSRTIVFDAPRHARGFFEALLSTTSTSAAPTTSNPSSAGGSAATPSAPSAPRSTAATTVACSSTCSTATPAASNTSKTAAPCASRPSVTPRDLGGHARLPNLDELQAKARACNRRILQAERVGQGCVLAGPAFERVAHPTVDAAGRRTPALGFGDPRVMALTGALCQTLLAATGFTNTSLRAVVAGLLGIDYRPGQMTYDLRRLRLAGLIRRLPRSNRYTSPPTASASPSSTPSATTGCWSRSPPPTSPKHPPTCAPRWPPSPATWTTTPPALTFPGPRELDTNVQKPAAKDR